METTYSTEQLIALLKSEMKQCMDGKSVVTGLQSEIDLKSAISLEDTGIRQEIKKVVKKEFGNNPVAKYLTFECMEQIITYQDFRDLIHQYQREHNVSGIVWRTVSIGEREIKFPNIHDQLISLPQDLELMASYKDRVLNAWLEAIKDPSKSFEFWRASESRDETKGDIFFELPEVLAEIEKHNELCEWATLWNDTNYWVPVPDKKNLFVGRSKPVDGWEFYSVDYNLTIGWGCPIEAMYETNGAGSYSYHAVFEIDCDGNPILKSW